MNTSTRSPLRALLVTPGLTFMPGDTCVRTPDDALAGGLAGLLGRVQARFEGEGVLLLDGRTAVALGLPVDGQTLAGGVEDHPVLAGPRGAGWNASALWPWTTYHGESRATVHVGILPAIDPARSPLICPNPDDTLTALTRWHELIGTSYRGTPGVAGTAALKALADAGDGKECTWQLDSGPGDANTYAYEQDFKVEQWKGPLRKGHRFRHGYDAYRMYLAAAGVTPLTPWRLKPTGKVGYTKDRAGWWLVAFAPWQGHISPEPILLPDPAGYPIDLKAKPGTPRWVTGPTLDLVDGLVEESIHGGYEVISSWTGPVIKASNGRPLRPWADRLRDASYALPEPGDRTNGALPLYDTAGVAHPDAVAHAVKAAYRETWGLLGSSTALVRRPDWHYAILAQARANLWRKMRKVGREEKRWPVQVDVDNVWYSSADDDPVKAAPKSWQIIGETESARLGMFKHKGTKTVGKAA
jgi:hypothetical protein